MKTFDTLREGDFIHCPEEGDTLKYFMWDYFSTGKKIPCLCDERSVWPSTEIYAGDYELLHRFEKNVVVEITPVSDYTAIIEMLNGKRIWCATDTRCKDADAFSKWLFGNEAVNFYYKKEYAHNSVKCDGCAVHLTKDEFAEYI